MIRVLSARRGEEGSSLVLALAFLALFGVFVAVILSFADASFKTGATVREVRELQYTADGAVEGAINTIRENLAAGVAGSTGECFALPDVLGRKLSVDCEGMPGSGVRAGGTPGVNAPKNAVLTLSRDAGEVGIRQSSNAAFRLRGAVISNSTIANQASSAVMAIDGTAMARGTCAGAIVTTVAPGLPECNLGTATIADSEDPAWPSPISTPPPLRAVPTCPGPNSLITFQPGTYDDAGALNALFGGGCARSVVWLQPGVYYFDFQNSGTHEWRINEATMRLVGGTPRGWTPPAIDDVVIPGACKTEDDAAPNAGVELVFGGDSRLNVLNGTVELCATPSETQQQVAIRGVPVGGGAAPVGPSSMTATGATGTVFAPASGAVTAGDGTVAAASLRSSGPTSGNVTFTGYNQVTVPADATITAVTLRVAHLETGGNSDLNALNLQAQIGGVRVVKGSCGGVPAPCVTGLTAATTLHTDTVDLTAQFSTPASLSGLTVSYTASVPTNGNRSVVEQLDGITIAVTYRPAGLRAASGCLIATPYPAGGCALLRTSGAQTTVHVHGTVYAPASPIDLALTNIAAQVIARGLVSRVLHVSVTPSAEYTGPMIALPTGLGPRADRLVRITANVDSVPRARAIVRFRDGGGSTPGASVQVVSWTFLP